MTIDEIVQSSPHQKGWLAYSDFAKHFGGMRQLPDDFRDFLSILNTRQVEYLVVGGWALGVHGYVRATGDMDIWVGLKEENLNQLISALKD